MFFWVKVYKKTNKKIIVFLSFFLILYVFLILISSCGEKNKTETEILKSIKLYKKLQPDTLLKINKHKRKIEEQQIKAYVKRRNIDCIITGTGLRYQILKHGKGNKGAEGKKVTYLYDISLINGQKIYNSNEMGSKSFTIEKEDVESGLNEAMYYLKEGDIAKLIIPSYLGYGLIGDRVRIPGDATLIYEIEILKIE